MGAILKRYPNVHCTINLSPTLLVQLQENYVRVLEPYVGRFEKGLDFSKIAQAIHGKIDPWFELLLKPSEEFDRHDKETLCHGCWGAFSPGKILMGRFPEYAQLKGLYDSEGVKNFSPQQLRETKFWFCAAYFDPDFLNGPVQFISGTLCDLSDLFVKKRDGAYWLKHPVTEMDCVRLFFETAKVLKEILPVHRALRYDPGTHRGQIELTTTPYAHPILPLLYDSEAARECQPTDPLPSQFHFPHDAMLHIERAKSLYEELFGVAPIGMWPAEGAVHHEVLSSFSRSGIRWIASDQQILEKSIPSGCPHLSPYTVSTKWSDIVIFFRDTTLSDKIGFKYQTMNGKSASRDFFASLDELVAKESSADQLLTVILDGENAWEWYEFDHDGKEFLHSLYSGLEELYRTRKVITVTPSEYLLGNPERGIHAHPPAQLPHLERLAPGSWIHGDFHRWIGGEEKNRAWEYLRTTRVDLENAGVQYPALTIPVPSYESKEWHVVRAWESLLAAEGSDWFWWYGDELPATDGNKIFDEIFRDHLKNVYKHARASGASLPHRRFPPIDALQQFHRPEEKIGAMVKGSGKSQRVLFTCKVPENLDVKQLYIVGNISEFGNWLPNKIKMYDDGTHGDHVPADRIWSLEVLLPVGSEVKYKYTRDGILGLWEPGEEFPGLHRTIVVERGKTTTVNDNFGTLS